MKYPISEPLDSSVWLADQWIELHASPREIWPWLAQMGNGRPGYLEPFENKTRLWTRLRVTAPSWLVKYTLGPAHKIMQNKQFLEIKKRVEHNL